MKVPKSLEDTFEFFESPHNLARITPPWLSFRVIQDRLEMRRGLVIDYKIRWLGISMKWRSRITVYDPPARFVDMQEIGPYSLWHHLHTFQTVPGGTLVSDEVTYALPLGPLGRIVHAVIVKRQLLGIFRYRQEALKEILGGEELDSPVTEQQLAEYRA
jgi:ligand-binding SRPBCC domain-containing protein